jgi:hypothetical protein
MTPKRRRASAGRLTALIVLLLLCMWTLYKVFIAVPPAPPPEVKTGLLPGAGAVEAAALDQPLPSHQRSVFSTSSLA